MSMARLAEDSLTKSKGLSCLMELIYFYSKTSAIKKAALYSVLLEWDWQDLFFDLFLWSATPEVLVFVAYLVLRALL